MEPVSYPSLVGPGVCAAVSMSILVGCATPSGGHAASQTPPPNRRRISYALYTHCGINEARIGKTYYVADHQLSDGQGNPPPGWEYPYQEGTMSMPAPGVAVFRDRFGHVIRFRGRPHATAFLHICS